MDYEQLIYERFVAKINDIDDAIVSDIYVLSLMYSSPHSGYVNENDEYIDIAYQAAIQMMYNTLSNSGKGKWIPAYWEDVGDIAPITNVYGEKPDEEELIIRDKWCEAIDLVYIGKDENGRLEYDEHELYDATRKACKRVIQRIHQNGVIRKKFKQDIPVLIHSVEGIQYEDEKEIAEANPFWSDFHENPNMLDGF